MVSDRQSHFKRQLSTGEDHRPKSQGVDPESSGGSMTDRRADAITRLQLFLIRLLSASACLRFSGPVQAQESYPENQTPPRGVEIAYTVTIRNPASHLYDVEVSIKGIRETSVSVSMPAWSPGVYRIENYARNVQDFRAASS